MHKLNSIYNIFNYIIQCIATYNHKVYLIMITTRKSRESSIKFFLNMFLAAITLSIFISCIMVAGKLITGGVNYNVLQDVGLFFIVIMTLCLSSGTAFFLYTYGRELVITVSTYRFYKTLTGSGSLALLIESYYTTINSFNVPIKAQHTDGNGNIVRGQWNAVGDWSVIGKKTTRRFTQNERWENKDET